ncbi:Ribosomal RNA processing protein 1 B [Geranomyces variabilis]|uniref:Ribosomal RNA processing protein 1 B n=1 Tax=Geranomyces variabilis TaxID=109894 RepID=A0AAD5TEM5_9FUNG|nr:Ribosomal RNA processing protein 1 B [Geranomyces variabilis]
MATATTTKTASKAGTHQGFGNQLANTEKKVRDRAVRGLVKWLVANEHANNLQLLKLWKGLFYTFWMSDKPFIQEHLADKLAAVMLKLPPQAALRYVDAFWTIIGNEWHGIDRLRLDKFYMLLRKFHFYSFRFLESQSWEPATVTEYLKTLTNGPLKINDFKIADGLRYHTAEVFLDELQRAVTQPVSPETLLALLEPFLFNLAKTASDVVFDRVRENVFEPILKQKVEADLEDQNLTLPFNHAALGTSLFQIATGDDILVKNRPKVTDLFKRFAAACGDEIQVDHSLLHKNKPVLIKGAKPAQLIPPPRKAKKSAAAKAKVGLEAEKQAEEVGENGVNGVDAMDVDGADDNDDSAVAAAEAEAAAERGMKRKAAVAVNGDEGAADDKKKTKKKAKKAAPAAAAEPIKMEVDAAPVKQEEAQQKQKNKKKATKAATSAAASEAAEVVMNVETADDSGDVVTATSATVTIDVNIEDILSEADRAALPTLGADDQLSVGEDAVFSTPQNKKRKAQAKTTPRRRPESVVVKSADNTDPTSKKAVKFVLDQNKTKNFDYKLPVANEGTPTRKSNIFARKVLKATAPTPVSKKLTAALARAAALATAASEAAAVSSGNGSIKLEVKQETTEAAATPIKSPLKKGATPNKSPKTSPKRRPVAADLI